MLSVISTDSATPHPPSERFGPADVLTPLFKVQLEDVLARKHLPPLSLKDFEEWLLFIEQSPENLYFVLWLREYERKWAAWERRQQRHNNHHTTNGTDAAEKGRVTFSAGSTLSPSLALSFERARATFCTPGAPYELCVAPELLAPFFASPAPDSYANAPSSQHHTTPHAAHPHPSTFGPLSAHLHTRLRASLQRCVRAAYSNVGTFRATCGIVGGLVITLVGAGLPLLIEFVVQEARGSRWARLAALPGLWLGLTIIVASLRGVCMMVYVFGDFRQLRRFELERPPAPPPPLAVHVQQQMHQQHNPSSQDEKSNSNTNADRRKSSSVSLVSTSSASTSSSGMTSVYSTSSNPTNPMAAHSYPKKPPALHVHTPIRALTAPPRIAVHIPESRSSGFASSNVGSVRRDSVDQQQTTREGEEDGDENEEEEAEDGESVVSEDSDDSESDSASEESDHGIYVSPQYAPPDELAALDAQGVQAALAMARRMAGEAQQQQHHQQHVQNVGEGEDGGESPISVSALIVNDNADRMFMLAEAPTPIGLAETHEQPSEPQQPQQTARFIPAYPYAAYEYEAERDTWECDSPTSCSGGSAASGSGLGSRSGSGRGSSSFVCPVKKRVTKLFSSSSSAGVERQGEENREEGEDEAGRGPCWSIRTRSRTRSRSSGGRRSRTTSVGSRSVSGVSADVDLEKGVVAVDAPAATSSSSEEKQEKARGRRRTRRDAEKEADVPFDFDALPPREGRRLTQQQQQQQQTYNFNQAHIDVAALHHQRQFSSYPQRPTTTMTDAVAAPEPEGALDRLWAFFCPLKQSGGNGGGFSERLFGSTVPAGGDLEKASASAAHTGNSNSRWESSPPPPYAPAPVPPFASSSTPSSSSSPSSPISPLGAHQLPFPSSPPNLPAPVDTDTTPSSGAWQSRFAQAARVPAFGPVTRILSPVVSRAQWEIVVRSFMLAGLLSGMIIGGLLGVPVRH
ncbi:hypothetical protein SCHPADRAFT_998285 [Schizopora paradoxa]|uniref:RGS domain-containing protein n=1 Tax=Schizopora paradoxa TaxID=27342 RepID=A0A0H2S5R5_9AGAM|nr:hypothetical protein SCHPADRAFT_998285 [Schizopora paradoxa]